MAFGNPAGKKDLLCGTILGGRNKWNEELLWGSCNCFWFIRMGEVPLPSSFLFCTPKLTVSSAELNLRKQKENTETAPELQETVMGGVFAVLHGRYLENNTCDPRPVKSLNLKSSFNPSPNVPLSGLEEINRISK